MESEIKKLISKNQLRDLYIKVLESDNFEDFKNVEEFPLPTKFLGIDQPAPYYPVKEIVNFIKCNGHILFKLAKKISLIK